MGRRQRGSRALHRGNQEAAEPVPVYRLDYTNSENSPQRITVNGDTVVHRIPPGGRKSVPMEIDDAVVIWELTDQDGAAPQFAGTVIGQSGGIFLELRPCHGPPQPRPDASACRLAAACSSAGRARRRASAGVPASGASLRLRLGNYGR